MSSASTYMYFPLSPRAAKIIQESAPLVGTTRSLKGIAFRQQVAQKIHVRKGDDGKEKKADKGDDGKEKETDKNDKEEKKADKKDKMVRNFDQTIESDLIHIYCWLNSADSFDFTFQLRRKRVRRMRVVRIRRLPMIRRLLRILKTTRILTSLLRTSLLRTTSLLAARPAARLA